MKKAKMLFLSLGSFAIASAPLIIAASCSRNIDKDKEKDKTDYSKNALNEAIKLAEITYKDKETTNIIDAKLEGVKIENSSNDIEYSITKFEPNKLLNNAKVTLVAKYKDEGHKDLESDPKVFLISDFAINSEYLDALLNSEYSVFKLVDSSNPEAGEESVKTLDAYYLVNDENTINIKLENTEMFVPELNDLEVEYEFDETSEKNSKFSGDVDLTAKLVYKNSTNSKPKILSFEKAIASGVSADYLTKYKKLSFDYQDKNTISVNSFEDGELPTEKLEKIQPIFKDKETTVEKTKEFLNKHNIRITAVTINDRDYSKNSISFKVKAEGVDFGFEDYSIEGFKPVEKASTEKVDEFVNKLTFGDFYFVNEIKEDEEKNYDLFIKDGENEIDLSNPNVLTAGLLYENGITEFNKEKLYTVTFEESTKTLKATMNLNGKEYVVSTVITRDEPELDKYVELVGKEIKGEKSEILANELDDSNINLNINKGSYLNDPKFIKFEVIYHNLKPQEEKDLNKEGKATLVYKFKNELTNKRYEHKVVFEGLKASEVSESKIAKLAKENKLASGYLTAEAKAKLIDVYNDEKSNYGNEGIYKARVELSKKDKLPKFGESKAKATNAFDGVTFSKEFIDAMKSKSLTGPAKQKYVRIAKRENGQYAIAFKIKDDANDEVLYINLTEPETSNATE